MREMKKRVTAVLLIALIFSAAFPVSSFAAKNSLNKTKVRMTPGSSVQLKLKYKKGKVKWSSSKKSVATVSKKGKVKAHKKGTAYITAKVRGKKYKCKIIVVCGKKYNCKIIVKDLPVIAADYSAYLGSSVNCQVRDASIRKKVDKLCSGLTSDKEKATAIFNFVRDGIMTCCYEEDALIEGKFRNCNNVTFGNETRYGAVGTLTAKQGNDTDKTHLLIAMLRTAGIPARYCYGSCRFEGKSQIVAAYFDDEYFDYAFIHRDDHGHYYTDHVWAECLLDDKWVPADAACEYDHHIWDPEVPVYTNTLGEIKTWDIKSYKLYGYYASLPF